MKGRISRLTKWPEDSMSQGLSSKIEVASPTTWVTEWSIRRLRVIPVAAARWPCCAHPHLPPSLCP